MDTGHYNCRDYYVSGNSPSTSKVAAIIQSRNRSNASPMNQKIKRAKPFAFLRLPLELRQKVYSYLLPSAKAREATSIGLPFGRGDAESRFQSRKQPIIWEKGATNMLCVCRQIHDEYAAIMYGNSVFLIFVKYSSITFRYQWLLPSGLTPTSDMELLDAFPIKYLELIRQVHVSVDHPDSYTGMIKYNVGGKGLTYGVRKQVEKLAEVFKPRKCSPAGLNLVQIDLSNGNEHLDCEKRGIVRARERVQGTEDVQKVLEPLKELRGITSVKISGAVTEAFAADLSEQMTSKAEQNMCIRCKKEVAW
ncbi:hypothetical protein CAC42_801 [Sphaceloma murrayae]|uniref:Uncharacterized protein n=1 Tax=Sphaceloma murrayae TaxID=2082308 RepID=A0A2K1QKT9_9PEZI|nr:hypothetical protein CAC42_801 [Sphaceloma murrayae]